MNNLVNLLNMPLVYHIGADAVELILVIVLIGSLSLLAYKAYDEEKNGN